MEIKKNKKVSIKILPISIGYFFLFWLTAYPADTFYNGQSKDTFSQACYFINDKFFGIKHIFSFLGFEKTINPMLALFLLCVLMSILTIGIIKLIKTICKKLYNFKLN